MILKKVVHDAVSNTLEATWWDGFANVKCCNYAPPQKNNLLLDCGDDSTRRIDADGCISDDSSFPTVLEYVEALWTQEVLNFWATSNAPDYAAEKAEVLRLARELRDKIFPRLNGIQQDLEWNLSRSLITEAVAIPQIEGIMAAKVGLREITTYSTVLAASTGAETTAAIKARYAQLVETLYAASPYACTAFNGMDA